MDRSEWFFRAFLVVVLVVAAGLAGASRWLSAVVVLASVTGTCMIAGILENSREHKRTKEVVD